MGQKTMHVVAVLPAQEDPQHQLVALAKLSEAVQNRPASVAIRFKVHEHTCQPVVVEQTLDIPRTVLRHEPAARQKKRCSYMLWR